MDTSCLFLDFFIKMTFFCLSLIYFPCHIYISVDGVNMVLIPNETNIELLLNNYDNYVFFEMKLV